MPARFMRGTPLALTEIEMQLIPGFSPRSKGVWRSRYKYTGTDCDCRFCTQTTEKKKCCGFAGCICLPERIAAGCVSYGELLRLFLSEIQLRTFASRIDRGWWDFECNSYSASLSASMSITPDAKVPTASGKTMKSGYGINEMVSTGISTNQSSAVTGAQTAVTYFPEFQYQTYWRLLDRTGSGYNARFEFAKNRYSTYYRRTHFTPIWMPDGSCTLYTYLEDCWTPAGMLSMNLIDSVTISGNLWSDWHCAPVRP